MDKEYLKEPESLKGKVEVTAEHTLQKLRTIVQPDGKKGTWLRHLNDKQLAEVYHRIKLGQTVYHIVQIAQREWKVLPKSDPKSLCRAVRDFKNKAVGLLQAHAQSFPQTEEKKKFVEEEEKRAEAIVKKVDGLDELAWLIKIQKGRIEILITREKSSLPFKFTDKSIETLGKLLDTYIEYQLELGVLDRKPQEFDLTLRTQFDGLLKGALSDDGSRMLSAIERMLSMADKKALILKKGENGIFQLNHKRKEENGGDGAESDPS